MKANKSDLKDAFTFLWIAVVFFLITLDVFFPFFIFIMKGLLYFIGSCMFLLGIFTMIRCVFKKKQKDEILTESASK